MEFSKTRNRDFAGLFFIFAAFPSSRDDMAVVSGDGRGGEIKINVYVIRILC